MAGRKREPEGRRDSGTGFDRDPPLMGLDNGPADRQPHAHPTGTRAEVRVKNPVQRSGSIPSPLSVTANSTPPESACSVCITTVGSSGLRRRERIERVADQVHQHLLDLDGIAPELRQIGCQLESDGDSPLARLIAEDLLDVLDDPVRLEPLAPRAHGGSRTCVSAR